jgi:O-antigen ligase
VNFSTLQSLALSVGRWGVVGMAVSMPISRALFNLSALAMIIGWLLSGDWKSKLNAVTKNSSANAAVFLFLIGALSLFWVGAIEKEHWDQLRGYSRLLYIPIILTLLTTLDWERRAWLALLTGMLVTLIAYSITIFFKIPGLNNMPGYGVFYHHIAQGMALSFLSAYALHQAIYLKKNYVYRFFWLIVCFIILGGLIIYGISRTSQISAIAACTLVIIFRASPSMRVASLLITLMVSFIVVFNAPNMRDRFALGLKEAASFEQDGELTSIGARLKAWQFSTNLIRESPWTGNSIGAYRPAAYEYFKNSPICTQGVCEQPHNQFILTTFETGFLGLLTLMAFLITPLFNTSKSKSVAAQLTLPFLAIVIITACFDSILQIQGQLFFTVTTLGIILASANLTISKSTNKI